MARPKAFDTTGALEAAMHVFWSHGYEAASLDMLLDAMGISKQSLYDTYGEKRALYLQALAYYRNETLASMRRLFVTKRTAREGFARLLLGIAAETPEQHARGCLLLSANLERATDDRELVAFLRDNQTSVEAIFIDALRRGQARGDVEPRHDPAALARFFATTIQGMRATARLKSDRRALRQIARVALAVLD